MTAGPVSFGMAETRDYWWAIVSSDCSAITIQAHHSGADREKQTTPPYQKQML